MKPITEPDRAARAAEERRRTLLEGLRGPATLAALRHTAFFAARRSELEALLGAAEIAPHPTARPRVEAFLRVAQWNIEKGREFDRILRLLREHPALAAADVLLLNEADYGMARSGNRHVAGALAAAL